MPDSAGTATALFTGVKTGFGMIGMDHMARRGHCERREESQLSSLADWAAGQGKRVGVVSTARITHATPAAVYAHSNDRSDLTGDDSQDNILWFNKALIAEMTIVSIVISHSITTLKYVLPLKVP